jgi:hypothetical protein
VINKPHSSVWETSNECWDDFLNDPVIAREIDSARRMADSERLANSSLSVQSDDSVDDRLLAYETPITDEILRQPIK